MTSASLRQISRLLVFIASRGYFSLPVVATGLLLLCTTSTMFLLCATSTTRVSLPQARPLLRCFFYLRSCFATMLLLPQALLLRTSATSDMLLKVSFIWRYCAL